MSSEKGVGDSMGQGTDSVVRIHIPGSTSPYLYYGHRPRRAGARAAKGNI